MITDLAATDATSAAKGRSTCVHTRKCWSGNRRSPRRGIWGWMFFDWAAQPFFTRRHNLIFGPYFVSRMASDPASGQAAWGYGIAAAGLIIAILSPVLGSIADQTGRRKPWIGFFAIVKIVACHAVVCRARFQPIVRV